MVSNTQQTGTLGGSRWRIAAWTAATLLLLLPLIAMQFTDEVHWTFGDFIFATVLILSVGLPIELVVRRTKSLRYRAGAGVALCAAFLIVWLSGAVGIIGSESHSANLLYFGVLAGGIVGAIAARFRPLGMARAMFATALTVIAIAVLAFLAGWGSEGPIWPWEVLILNGFFAALFAGSGLLFREAAREGDGF
ncbi:hypothetical protein BH23BAC4_BH23BAC4_08590 [soil metagenome]